MTIQSDDKPIHAPVTRVDGGKLKTLTHALLFRRATAHFKPDPFPAEYLEAILRFAAQSPSGYNLQPWRFLVVQEEAGRQRLQKAAMNQAKVGEAPVVVIFFAIKGEWKKHMHWIFQEGARRGVGQADQIESMEKSVLEFSGHFLESVWLNRHIMIAFTTMMLTAEVYGLDTAPMEGFDPEAVKHEFGLPAEAEVIALLAIGFAKEPDKAYGGRLPLQELVHYEKYGNHQNPPKN